MAIILSVMIIVTSMFTVSSSVFAETTSTEGFKSGDTVYFDCSSCGENWTSAYATEYINFTEYSKADNGGSNVTIADADKTKYNPVKVTNDLGNYTFSYTFTDETAGAKSIRFWRGNSEKLWNNSPVLTYEDFANGNNCVYATDLEGNGSVGKYGTKPTETKPTEPSAPTTGEFKFSYAKANNLYVHGVTANESETEAWQVWQHKYDEKGNLTNDGDYYFFLPSSTDKSKVDIYNTFSSTVKIGNTEIPSKSTVTFNYTPNSKYTVTVNSTSYTLNIMRSGAECAVYVNNAADFNGKDLLSYLSEDKSNNAKATAAVTESNGKITDTSIKKVKGRGNTSWGKSKKSFNLNFDSALSVAGMEKTKKYSIVANYQDDSLTRNRFLYDLGDQVGIPYNSDSRYADFYMNGVYLGSYQLCQKIDVGADNLISDMTGEEYINEDGTTPADFPFVIKIDGAAEGFAFYTCGQNVEVVSPDITSSDKGYDNAYNYIKAKFEKMYNAVKNNHADLADVIDVDSFARMYLINEFCKNWDAGVSSFYFVNKPDANGKYKMYAAPTWDYDNSLGNAVGMSWGSSSSSYTKPEGYYISSKGDRNMCTLMFKNPVIFKRSGELWYKDFVPAIEYIFKGQNISTGELYSSDVYYNLVKDSAEMNYTSGRLINPEPQWIADHSTLYKLNFDYKTKTYSRSTTATKYNTNTFKGVYDYMVDWANSRAAYMSNMFIDSYVEPVKPTEPTTPTEPTKPTKPEHQVGANTLSEFYFDSTGKVTEDKLEEYGDKSGYNATFGQANLFISMDGENGRALEWSVAEYGKNGDEMVPIFTAGKKNPWGDAPYIQTTFDGTDCTDLTFSIDMGGSSKAPANWKMQYSIDGTNFKDISNTNFTITSDNRKILTTYINKVKLPEECNGAKSVTVRIIATSRTTIAGGDTSENPTGGEIAVNNIVIEGKSTRKGLIGDLNLDGKIDVQDATILQKYTVKKLTLTDAQKAVADVNNDGKINIKDCSAIQKMLVRIS